MSLIVGVLLCILALAAAGLGFRLLLGHSPEHSRRDENAKHTFKVLGVFELTSNSGGIMLLGFAALFLLMAVKASSANTIVTPAPPETSRGTATSPANKLEGFPSDAQQAYLALVQAYNAGDVDAYTASYADPIACFYNQRGVSAAIVRKRIGVGVQLHVTARDLKLVQRSEDEIVFCDHGSFSSASGAVTSHHKTITMRRLNSVWRVSIEVSPTAHDCAVPRC